MSTAAASTPTDRDFVITRVVNAPRDLVWKSWTEVERLKEWWGPKGATVFFATLALKPGGAFHYGMRTADGMTIWGKFVFREISAPHTLVFLSSFSDEQGGVTRAPFFDGQWPMQLLSTITFAERDGKTEVTVRWAPSDATEAERAMFASQFDSMNGGWGGTLEQLNAYLARA
jgi:uncharacterized protein YndB with AHSA1/START domain